MNRVREMFSSDMPNFFRKNSKLDIKSNPPKRHTGKLENECLQCKKVYSRMYRIGKYCSYACAGKSKIRKAVRVEKECLQCKKVYSRIYNIGEYCSNTCANKRAVTRKSMSVENENGEVLVFESRKKAAEFMKRKPVTLSYAVRNGKKCAGYILRYI